MSMTLEELHNIFAECQLFNGQYAETAHARWRAERAGIRAVVEALRDEICKRYGFQKIWDDFDEILGDAGEKAAGGPTCEDGQASQPGFTTPSADYLEAVFINGKQVVLKPAAGPSPEVCEWRMVGKTFANAGCEDEYLWSHEYKVCPSCGKPISFREK